MPVLIWVVSSKKDGGSERTGKWNREQSVDNLLVTVVGKPDTFSRNHPLKFEL